jgi:transposase
MPYRSEEIPIAGTKHDSRRKLSEEQKQAIKILHKEGYSYRKLAEMFNVSKWCIQSIINPSVRSKSRKQSKEYWSEAKRKYRKKKQELYKNGDINNKISKRRPKKPP